MAQEQTSRSDTAHREEIDSRNASRLSEIKEEIKDIKRTKDNLKELSKNKRKSRIQEHVKEFREDFEDPTYFVELTERSSRRLDSLNDEIELQRDYVLERMISLSLSNLDKTKPLLIRDLYLDDLVDEEIARRELGSETIETLNLGRSRSFDVNL